jgi:formylglycine-generating enzyme required for sulfatase activity
MVVTSEGKGIGSAHIIKMGLHPLADGRPPSWASGWGQDTHGVFVDFTYRDITQSMRWCPPGRFLMGSPGDEREDGPEHYNYEGPQTEITVMEGFWLFDTAVTQALYEAVMGTNPSRFAKGGGDRPVEQVSWEDAGTFLQRLNGEIPGLGLYLPSEAQWEYACRAGSTTPFEPTVASHHGGRDITADEVNYNGNYPMGEASEGVYREQTVPVKGAPFRPNAWGLWHMHGNVDEWCADIWHDGHDGADLFDKPRLESGTGEELRVVRGGSWYDDAGPCRAAIRDGDAPDDRSDDLGFRPAGGHPTSSSQPRGRS